MTTADAVLTMLEAAAGSYVSGEEIARQLGLSRAAVWKAVKTLTADGWEIEAASHRGYRLSGGDVITAGTIRAMMPEGFAGDIIVKQTTASTNTDAKHAAAAGAPHGTIVIAEEQTAGRGRMGRSFYSGAGGLYMSIVLRMGCAFADAVRITTSAAVAVCQTIETISPLRPEIKWVNDILADGRKVCGISCEAVSDFESGMVEYVIVGMGINFKTTVFPDELNGIAGGLFSPDEPVTRNRFAAMAVSRLLSLAADMNNPDIIREYRRLSAVIGRPVKFCEKNVWYEAEALDVDENGGLVVREADGRVRTLVSGEITLRVRK